MSTLSWDNPVFHVYVAVAAILALKTLSMSMLTVYRMLRIDAGYRSPEDGRGGLVNRNPRPGQLDANDYVDRIRRIHQNDLENIPVFLVVGLLFLFTGPSLGVAQVLYYGYAVSRLVHFAVYVTAQSHEVRAAVWTAGYLIVVGMAVATLASAVTT